MRACPSQHASSGPPPTPPAPLPGARPHPSTSPACRCRRPAPHPPPPPTLPPHRPSPHPHRPSPHPHRPLIARAFMPPSAAYSNPQPTHPPTHPPARHPRPAAPRCPSRSLAEAPRCSTCARLPEARPGHVQDVSCRRLAAADAPHRDDLRLRLRRGALPHSLLARSPADRVCGCAPRPLVRPRRCLAQSSLCRTRRFTRLPSSSPKIRRDPPRIAEIRRD